MRSHKAITKYLQRFAEPESRFTKLLKVFHPAPFQQAVIIPACNESPEFLARILALPTHVSTLWVVVLNGPEQITQEHLSSSKSCLDYLQAHCSPWQQLNPYSRVYSYNQHTVCCLDLIQAKPPSWPYHGVGFARKLAMDICLWLYQDQHLVNAFVRSTDADVAWPKDYLGLLPNQFDHVSALLYPFRHGPVNVQDPDYSEAAAIYDCWLRYYVNGLSWAQCPWAFHTIGSTMVINLQHYAINRGFPKKDAAEDFYLLNKLAKTGNVAQLHGPSLVLSNRISQRTPFGTGKSIQSMANTNLESWNFYHPDVFVQLKYWYQYQAKQYQCEQLNLPPEAEPLRQALCQLGIEKHLKHCANISQDEASYRKQLNLKMDSATIRKCVHLLRDEFYGSVSFVQLLEMIEAGSVPFIEHTSQALEGNRVRRLSTLITGAN